MNMPGKRPARKSAEATEITENSNTSAVTPQKTLTAVKSKRVPKDAGSTTTLRVWR